MLISTNKARDGLRALEYYCPKDKRFRQAHMHAAYALLNVSDHIFSIDVW